MYIGSIWVKYSVSKGDIGSDRVQDGISQGPVMIPLLVKCIAAIAWLLLQNFIVATATATCQKRSGTRNRFFCL
jgi:hypothetical protein